MPAGAMLYPAFPVGTGSYSRYMMGLRALVYTEGRPAKACGGPNPSAIARV